MSAPAMTDAAGDRVVVVGAGIVGLTVALRLARAGRRGVVLEAGPTIGGLASSVEVAGTPVERFYHFICLGDVELIALAEELGLGHDLRWRHGGTAFYHDGRLYPFGRPLDLLRFTPVPFGQRLRFGLNVVWRRYRRSWRHLDGVSARQWLTRRVGRRAYEVIWEPLLRIKFGDASDRVSAAWIWHRIHRLATSRRGLLGREVLGCFGGGSAALMEALARELRASPLVELRVSSPVRRILTDAGRVHGVTLADGDTVLPCRAVLSTVALPRLTELAPDLDAARRRAFASTEYLGVVCVLLHLERPLTGRFWVNVNDARIPFNGVIEYTALNDHPRFGDATIAYVPHYLPTEHPRFSWDDDRLRAEAVAGLALVQPAFDEGWVRQVVVSRARFAQAVCTVGFAEQVPPVRAGLDGLYLTDSTQFYPEDRTLSAAIRMADRVSSAIDHDLQTAGIDRLPGEGGGP